MGAIEGQIPFKRCSVSDPDSTLPTKEADYTLRRGIAEEPLEVPGTLVGYFGAPGEKVVFICGERSFNVIGRGNERPGKVRAIIQGEVRPFACER